MPTQPRILMCPPDYYGIEYEINPWMKRNRPSDQQRAAVQWNALRRLLETAGASVELQTPVQGLPDLVFTANAGLIYQNMAVLSRFRYPQRQGEQACDASWFGEHGFDVREIPGEWCFEGAGDALFCGETLFAGYRMRSDANGHQDLGRMLGVRAIPLELVDAYYYHLDTCFCPLAPSVAIVHRGAFDDYGLRVLDENIETLIPVHAEEARHFACNAVVIGNVVVTNTGCPQLHKALRSGGFDPWETPLDEFVKSGGSAKCLTLRLDGEDAAAWRDVPSEPTASKTTPSPHI